MAWSDHLHLVRTSVTINEVYSLKCLLEFVSFTTFALYSSKGTECNKRTKYRQIISKLSRDQLLFIDESAKIWQDFWASISIISCVRERERVFYAICVVGQWPIICKTDKRGFVDAPYMIWLTVAETKFSPDEHPPPSPNGRVKLKTVVILKTFKSLFRLFILGS